MNFLKLSIKSFCYVLVLAILISCSTSKIATKNLKENDAVSSYFKAFVLYDPVRKEQLINYNGSKYFTPASNTKLFTFYTAYKVLQDSIKALEYARLKDSLLIRGTADPSFLYGFDSTKVVDFLKKDSAAIFLVNAQIDEPTLGSGWSWDDYPYYYMPEKNIFPLYGNLVNYSIQHDTIFSTPSYFKDVILIKDSISTPRKVSSNTFYIRSNDTLQRTTPYKTSNTIVAALLERLLDRRIQLVSEIKGVDYQSLYATSKDSLLKKMLVVSDNFIAEQLLLQVGKEVSNHYSVDSAISYSLKHYLYDLPQEPRWVDGSGLSRYNLFTPESMVKLLEKMYNEIPRSKLLTYFPVGGSTGTLKNWYGNSQGPYVFAKSGTLSNNYNLSGYLITEKGRLLIFSCMNNHFKIPLSAIKTDIERLLLNIHKQY